VAQAGKEPGRGSIDILVGQESHGVGAKWMSSKATTSIAY
jgi:hypothetical protein